MSSSEMIGLNNPNTLKLGECNGRIVYLHDLCQSFHNYKIHCEPHWVGVWDLRSKRAITLAPHLLLEALKDGCRYVTYCGQCTKEVDGAVCQYNSVVSPECDDEIVSAHSTEDLLDALWNGIYLGFSESLGQFPDVHLFTSYEQVTLNSVSDVLRKFRADNLPEDIHLKL